MGSESFVFRFLQLAVSPAVSLTFAVGILIFSAQGLTADETHRVFSPEFTPRAAPHGGFGGGSCRARKTPVVFVHGNAHFSDNWWDPTSDAKIASVLDAFKAAGYRDCELFGITYLSEAERRAPLFNYHDPAKAAIISDFIQDVLAYTKSDKVDLVGHSFGVTMTLFAVDRAQLWTNVRTFLGIAGGMRGINACVYVSRSAIESPTCAPEGAFGKDTFGFFPDGISLRPFPPRNPRMANEGEVAFADLPKRVPHTRFYTLRAGIYDQVVCGSSIHRDKCEMTSMFNPAPNVRAQINVGSGIEAPTEIERMRLPASHSDAAGTIGHFRVKNDTGVIQVRMIADQCSGEACCRGYNGLRCDDKMGLAQVPKQKRRK